MEMVAVPKSVLAYFNDDKVKGSVEVLLGRKRPQVPSDLPWDDVRSYYRALAAAQAVQFDYADLLCAIWDATWEAISPLPKATALPLTDCDPQTVWNWSEIDRAFSIGPYTCEMMVYLDATSGAQIGIDLKQARRALLKRGDFPSDWEKGQAGFWSPPSAVEFGQTIDTQKLRGFASQARKICIERLKA